MNPHQFKKYSIILHYKNKQLEHEFGHYYYGKKIAVRQLIGCTTGCILYGMYVFTISHTWMAIWAGICSFCFFIMMIGCLIPKIVEKTYILEIIMSILLINPILRSGLYHATMKPIPSVFFATYLFEFSYYILVRPRISNFLIMSLLGTMTYTIYVPIVYWGYKIFPFVNIIYTFYTYYFLQFSIFSFLFFCEKGTRSYFEESKKLEFEQKKLNKEKQTSLRLLYNILPKCFIKNITENGIENNCEIKVIDDCCIIQSDIVHFTQFSQDNTSEQVVYMLNSVFSYFDILSSSFGQEKVKSIGDGYLSISDNQFLNAYSKRSKEDFVVDDSILCGIGMLLAIFTLNKVHPEWNLKVRIGICRSRVFAAIFGSNSINFDIYGEGVQLVNRLEQSAPINHIKINQDLYNSLDKKDYKFSKLGCIIEVEKYKLGVVQNPEKYEKLRKAIEGIKSSYLKKKFSFSRDDIELSTLLGDEKENCIEVIDKRKPFIENMKKFMKIFKPKTQFGFRKYLMVYDSFEMMKKYQLHKLVNRRLFQICFFSSAMFYGFGIILYFITTMKFNFLYDNPYIITVYVSIFVEFLSVILFILPKLHAVVSVNVFVTFSNIACYITISGMQLLVTDKSVILDFIFVVHDLYVFLFVSNSTFVTPIVKFGFFLVQFIISVFRIVLTSEHFPVSEIIVNAQHVLTCLTVGLIVTVVVEIISVRTFEKELSMKKQKDLMQASIKYNEKLILSVLPEFVYKQVKDTGKKYKCVIEQACVCFSRIKIDKNMDIKTLIFMLQFFNRMDEIVENNSCIKIKSFHENYMFYSINKCSTNDKEFIEKVIRTCLSCQDLFYSYKKKYEITDQDIILLTGLKVGKFSGGVVGSSKYIFDCFGDVVNYASRLCNSGIKQEIHTSEGIIDFIDKDKYDLKCNGEKMLKGKGMKRTYSILPKTLSDDLKM